jgi:RimJ/RimL family protein N-acetyltransferase
VSPTVIRPVTPDDFERLAAWLSVPTVNAWLTSEWRGRQVTGSMLAVMMRNKANALFLAETAGQPFGLVGFAAIDPPDGTGMVWYVRGEAVSVCGGSMSTAVVQAVRWAFTERELRSVYAWVIASNHRSARLLERAGFRFAGRLRQACAGPEGPEDRLYYDIVRGEVESMAEGE